MPMTEKLFYEDPFLKEFSAAVLNCREEKGLWIATLDRTAFYPEGGGQPADHGTLGNVKVFDTKEKNGEILHFCEGPLKAGETVQGAIDWARRFDFMQQHSGEHIVSGILCGKFGCDNVGFHIGHELVTIDFNAELSTEDVLFVENLANQYIWEDRAIQIQWPSPAQLEAMEYRSKKALSGAVRIVSWPGADCCACCGTHVRSSGQVGMVKLISCQKFRDGVRIEMAAGGRALKWANQMAGQNTRVSQLLSAKPGETAAAVERLRGVRISDSGFQLPAFACSPMRLNFWEGDEEFEAQANLLFDRSATDFIHVESVVTIASEGVRRLAEAAGLGMDRQSL